jgi:hypothetical protein
LGDASHPECGSISACRGKLFWDRFIARHREIFTRTSTDAA